MVRVLTTFSVDYDVKIETQKNLEERRKSLGSFLEEKMKEFNDKCRKEKKES